MIRFPRWDSISVARRNLSYQELFMRKDKQARIAQVCMLGTAVLSALLSALEGVSEWSHDVFAGGGFGDVQSGHPGLHSVVHGGCEWFGQVLRAIGRA